MAVRKILIFSGFWTRALRSQGFPAIPPDIVIQAGDARGSGTRAPLSELSRQLIEQPAGEDERGDSKKRHKTFFKAP